VNNLAVMLLTVALTVTLMAPMCAEEPALKLPTDGNGLLEFCSVAVNAFDSPSSPAARFEMFKAGWCAGHFQTMSEMIVYWQVQVVRTGFMSAGDKDPSTEQINEIISKSPAMTCIPNAVSGSQMARILVKWLREHPDRLHEKISILSEEAFQSAFPCQPPVSTKKPATD
jgi:hypothetical protein